MGPSTVSLGDSALSSTPVVRIVRPLPELLAYRTGVTAALGTRTGLEMIYLSSCRAYEPITLQLSIGSVLPIWRTAMGLAYVVAMESEMRDELVGDLRRNEPGCASLLQQSIGEAMESYERYGYVCSFGTLYSYINVVGVTFRPTDDHSWRHLRCDVARSASPPRVKPYWRPGTGCANPLRQDRHQ